MLKHIWYRPLQESRNKSNYFKLTNSTDISSKDRNKSLLSLITSKKILTLFSTLNFNRLNQRFLKLTGICTLSLLVIACEKDMTDLVTQVNNIKTLPAGRIDEIPEFIPYQNFEYTAQSLRDPFVISSADVLEDTRETIAKITSGIKPDLDRVKEPLENFPLDTLRFKGTVTTTEGTKWALIFAPDNTIHRVIEGYHLGQNHGRIFSVEDNQIQLTEIVPDGLGNYIEREAALALIN